MLEADLLRLHLVVEASDLAENVAVLRGDAVRRVEAVDEVVEAGGAEQHREGVALPVRGIERDESRRERCLCTPETLLRNLELYVICLQVGANAVQLHGREVVRLDCPLEARVELLHLAHDALGLGLLRGDRGVAGGRRRRQRGREAGNHDCRRRTSNRAANRSGRWARSAPREGPVRHKFGTLATRSDTRNRLFKPKSSHCEAAAQPHKVLC